MASAPVVVVPGIVVDVLDKLTRALRGPVVLAGGWAVHSRLVMAGRTARPTEDVDVLLTRGMRPAKAALEAIHAVQDDARHAARLTGLPLVVDLLADDEDEALKVEPGVVCDDDGLRMIVPPLADLLSDRADEVVLVNAGASVRVLLPTAGSLFASKLSCLFLEWREPQKKAADAADALALLEAIGPVALGVDLRDTPVRRRLLIADRLEAVGYSALAAQSRLFGTQPYPGGAVAVPLLIRTLREDAGGSDRT